MLAQAAGASKRPDRVDSLSVRLLMCEVIQLLHEDCNACCHRNFVDPRCRWRSVDEFIDVSGLARLLCAISRDIADACRSKRRPYVASVAVCDATRTL